MFNRLCFLVCEHFEPEVRAIVATEGWSEVAVAAFPGWCACPPLAWADLAQAAASCGACGRVVVVGSACVALLGEPPASLAHFEVDRVAQCFHRILNPTLVDHYVAAGVYLLSPGWLAHWPQRMADWGFDQAVAREFFGEFAGNLLLLDTGVDPQGAEHLRTFADFVARPFETLPVGLDFLRASLTRHVAAWRLTLAQAAAAAITQEAQRQAAEHAMVVDLVGTMTNLMTESEAIDNVFSLFTGLFAPTVLAYLPMEGETAGVLQLSTLAAVDETALTCRIRAFDYSRHSWVELERGFLLRIGHGNKVLGILLVDEVAFAEYKDRYVNLALSIAGVCGLALNNARTYRQISEAEAQLRMYNEHLEQLVAEKLRELEFERVKSLQAGKLAAIGEMATGVAHELNQPLTAMLFDVDYLKALLAQSQAGQAGVFDLDELRQVADGMTRDIARCRRIIDHLRSFGRVAPTTAALMNLNDTIENALILTGERLRQRNVDLQLRLLPELPLIRANSHTLEQVFLNFFSNAEYALAQRAARELASVPGETSETPTYRKVLEICTGVEGPYVVATVRDNGCGMSPEVQSHVFEPFFTTKPVGEGTGLGLSISYGIVTEAGGEITIDGAENVGAVFTLRFPIAAGSA